MINCLVLIIISIIFPFWGMFFSFVYLYKCGRSDRNLNKIETLVILICISFFFGLLSYSQKSHALIGTDSLRYYSSFKIYENYSFADVINTFDIKQMMHFVFEPVTALFTSLTGNVQSITFLWVFISYLFTFFSIRRTMVLCKCYTLKSFFLVLLLTTFIFIYFVQTSELLKNAAAFVLFFYGFTFYMESGINIKTILLLFVSLGLHPSVLMLMPLLLYRIVNTKYLIFLSVIIFPLSFYLNIIDSMFSLLPNTSYFNLILNKFGNNYADESGSRFYIIMQAIIFMLSFYLWKLTEYKNNIIVNIALLYFIMAQLNMYNLIAYLRFALLGQWIFALLFISILKVTNQSFTFFIKFAVVLLLIMNVRYTLSRTIIPGPYRSSYMDNSATKIILSSSADYLNEKYDK